MNRLLLCSLLVVGCAGENPNRDVVGPFTGPVRRYVVDTITLPLVNADARAFAADLDGDKTADNQLGMVISTLASQGTTTTHGPDMIASGAIASAMYIQANDLTADGTVSVRYVGQDGETDDIAVGGTFVDGRFVSNRTATTEVPGRARLVLPVFADADPSVIELIGMEIELVPDGSGGFHATIRGGVTHEDAFEATYRGLTQQFDLDPTAHRVMAALFDTNHDWQLSREEIASNSLVASLLKPDITIFDRDVLSIGFTVHLVPCETGRCSNTPPADTCHDRVKDGDESDLDCGGSCANCPALAACNTVDDCQTAACDGGTCAAATCSDGVRDGLETDVDCGTSCAACTSGQRCWRGSDCTSGRCSNECIGEDCGIWPITEYGSCL